MSAPSSSNPSPQARTMEYPLSPYATHASCVARILKSFRPQEFGLHSQFLLQNFTQMKGCGCKVPRPILLNMLKTFGNANPIENSGGIGIGLDSCVIPLKQKGLNLVQTTDFFYPLIDDPYIMGRITAANVLSDLYAMGVSDCDNMLMLLGVCIDLAEHERDVVVREFIKGFKDTASLAGTEVRGGQTVRSPWLLLGGVATSVVSESEMLRVDEAVAGDILIITKPLGTQVAVNAYEWMLKKNGRVQELSLKNDRIIRAVQQAMEQMCRLNRNAAILARKYRAHACTDVTGFGILGHADNLAKAQKNKVRFVIDSLPIIDYMEHISRSMNGNGFNLFGGTSAETSGGLLLAMSEEASEKFREELEHVDGFPTFAVGHVIEAEEGEDRGAFIHPRYEVVKAPSQIHSSAIDINI